MLKVFVFISAFVFQAYGFIVLPRGELRHGLQDGRVVGGVTAPEGGIPYQASLRSLFNSHFCGGTILNNRWVMTAAHCTIGQSKYSMLVIVGTNSLQHGGERYSVDTIIIHEDYNSGVISNDISLVKVTKDIEFGDTIQPIQLPEENTGAGADLVLTGWGRLSYPGVLPVNLQMLNLTSLSVDECQSIYNRINPVFSSQICSLTKSGEGACHGDSGGPLVEDRRVVGIVSWGMPCARGYPDVYTRVHYFKEWILNQIESTDSMDNSVN